MSEEGRHDSNLFISFLFSISIGIWEYSIAYYCVKIIDGIFPSPLLFPTLLLFFFSHEHPSPSLQTSKSTLSLLTGALNDDHLQW